MVLNLNTTEASPFATLLTWDPPEFELQNGPILSYRIVTTFSDPNANVTGLDMNFMWVNYTDNAEILLKELRPGIDFNSTVTPENVIGFGLSDLTIFSMIAGKIGEDYKLVQLITLFYSLETDPDIFLPDESDIFITVQEAETDKFSMAFECAARGNPVPLIHWVRNNGSRLDSPNITISGDSLTRGNNMYICNAVSRNGIDILRITIILVSEELDVGAIQDTQELVSSQTSLNDQETDDLSSLIRSTVQSVEAMNSTMNSTNETSNGNTSSIIGIVSTLYSDVINITERGITRNTSSNLFRTGGELVRTSQNDQGVAEDREVPGVSCNRLHTLLLDLL